MDDHSTDETARAAADAGARVVSVDDVLPELGLARARARRSTVGRRRTGAISSCGATADIREFAPHFVVGLVGPLLTRSDIAFVKGFIRPSRRRQPATVVGGSQSSWPGP
jgi:glucosyl-3-phosphoglycerate synthase